MSSGFPEGLPPLLEHVAFLCEDCGRSLGDAVYSPFEERLVDWRDDDLLGPGEGPFVPNRRQRRLRAPDSDEARLALISADHRRDGGPLTGGRTWQREQRHGATYLRWRECGCGRSDFLHRESKLLERIRQERAFVHAQPITIRLTPGGGKRYPGRG